MARPYSYSGYLILIRFSNTSFIKDIAKHKCQWISNHALFCDENAPYVVGRLCKFDTRAGVHLSGRICDRRFVCASVVLDDTRASRFDQNPQICITFIIKKHKKNCARAFGARINEVIFQVKYCARMLFCPRECLS